VARYGTGLPGGAVSPVLPPRGGAPATGIDPFGHGGTTGSGGAARGPAGLGGGMPMGLGGAGAGERTHRNQTFIPDDEPFVVEYLDIAPPVIGAGEDDYP
jgi:hypothetical protein